MYRVTVKCLAYQIISPVQPQQLKLEEDNGTVKAWVFEGSYMHSSGQRPVPGICWSRSFTLCVLEMKGCHMIWVKLKWSTNSLLNSKTVKMKVKKMMQQASKLFQNFLGATPNGNLLVCLTYIRHAPNETTDGLLGELLLDLDQRITELLESLKWNLVLSNGTKHIVPEVFYWI